MPVPSEFQRRLSAFVLALASAVIAACGAGASEPRPTAHNDDRTGTASIALSCLTTAHIEAIRQDPLRIRDAELACDSEVRLEFGRRGWSLSTSSAVIAAIVAHRMAPYGQSLASDLGDLLTAPVLDCDNYVLLAIRLTQHSRMPDSANRLRMLGLEGEASGNHAVLLLKDPVTPLFIDPTIGVIAGTDGNSLLAGKRVDEAQILDAFAYGPTSVIGPFHDRIRLALVEGSFKPLDLLYYFSEIDTFAEFQRRASADFADGDGTPTIRTLETPGASQMLGHP